MRMQMLEWQRERELLDYVWHGRMRQLVGVPGRHGQPMRARVDGCVLRTVPKH